MVLVAVEDARWERWALVAGPFDRAGASQQSREEGLALESRQGAPEASMEAVQNRQ